jgi:hypothetical protein
MTAQSILDDEKNENTAPACGTSCGANDDETKEESTACGSSCGAGE